MSAASTVRQVTSEGGSRGPSSRTSADAARGDRRVTAAVGLISAVIGVFAARLGQDTTAAVWVGLVTLCVTPGAGIACWLTTTERLTRVIAVLAASMTWTIFVTTVLAWLQVTHLGILLVLVAGMGGVSSAVFLITQYRNRVPVDQEQSGREWDPQPDGPGQDRRQAETRWDQEQLDPRRTEAGAHRRVASVAADAGPSSASRGPLIGAVIALVAAVGLLAGSVIHAHGRPVGSWGLLPVLGVPFYAAVVLTFGALLLALWSVRTAWPAAVAALGLLLLELNGTPFMLAATPLSSWTYKHFGVVDYVFHGGALSDATDIYQQWPGFFAAAAALVRLSGRASMDYGNWAQLFYATLCAVVLFGIARRFAAGNRIVPYITVMIYISIDWEGQVYFSPQTTALLLALMFQFFLLSYVEPEHLRRLFRNRRWLAGPPLAISGYGPATSAGSVAGAVGIVALFGAMVVTHQLSPYLVFAGVVSLWILGVLRRPWLVLALAIMLVGYPLLHLVAVQQNSVLNGFSFGNATGRASSETTSPQQQIGSLMARPIALGLWGAATVCVLSYRRRMGVVAIPAILAGVPFTFALVSSYDGEAIYRVFLFSSPWCALIVAKRLGDLRRLPALRWTVVTCCTLFAALASVQASNFGMFPVISVPKSEISADEYFLDHAPRNTQLLLVSANFPSHLNRRYTLHDAGQTQNDLSLDEIPAFDGNGLKNTSAESLARQVAQLDGGGYLVFSPSMVAYNNYYTIFAPGTMSALVPRLKASPYWKVWYENDGTYIFQAVPLGKPVVKSVPRQHLDKKVR